MPYKPLPSANPAYRSEWVGTANDLLDNVRSLISDVPAVRTDVTQLTTRVSLAETTVAGNSTAVEAIRSDVRSLSGQISASTATAQSATQAAAAAQTAASASSAAAQQSAAQVTGLSSAVSTATADVASLKTGKADKAALSTVAFSGKWVDLVGAPTSGGGGPVTVDSLPPGSTVWTSSSTTRPTTRTDVRVVWLTAAPPTTVMLAVDRWEPTFGVTPPASGSPAQTFDLADGSAWPAPWASAQLPTAGGATIQGGRGRLTTGKVGSYAGDDTIAMRYGVAANVDALFTFCLVTTDAFPRFVLRSDNASLDPGVGCVVGWSKSSIDITNVAGYAYSTAATAPKTHTVGSDYRMRVSLSGTAVKARTWPADATEPGTWDVTATATATSSGNTGFAVGSGNAAVSQVITVDDVTITSS